MNDEEIKRERKREEKEKREKKLMRRYTKKKTKEVIWKIWKEKFLDETSIDDEWENCLE